MVAEGLNIEQLESIESGEVSDVSPSEKKIISAAKEFGREVDNGDGILETEELKKITKVPELKDITDETVKSISSRVEEAFLTKNANELADKIEFGFLSPHVIVKGVRYDKPKNVNDIVYTQDYTVKNESGVHNRTLGLTYKDLQIIVRPESFTQKEVSAMTNKSENPNVISILIDDVAKLKNENNKLIDIEGYLKLEESTNFDNMPGQMQTMEHLDKTFSEKFIKDFQKLKDYVSKLPDKPNYYRSVYNNIRNKLERHYTFRMGAYTKMYNTLNRNTEKATARGRMAELTNTINEYKKTKDSKLLRKIANFCLTKEGLALMSEKIEAKDVAEANYENARGRKKADAKTALDKAREELRKADETVRSNTHFAQAKKYIMGKYTDVDTSNDKYGSLSSKELVSSDRLTILIAQKTLELRMNDNPADNKVINLRTWNNFKKTHLDKWADLLDKNSST